MLIEVPVRLSGCAVHVGGISGVVCSDMQTALL
jgi:hypothetical protein